MTGVLVDTGFLVSLFRPADRLRRQARDFLVANRHPLITAAPVIVETCFFLDADAKGNLLEWVQRGALTVVDVPVGAYAQINLTLRKYADRDIDFADAALVWLAAQTGIRGILTVDEADFALFRLQGGKRFELLDWRR
ncbi:MAG: PIN domain-containing protein [Betaproteobacteria bacterium]